MASPKKTTQDKIEDNILEALFGAFIITLVMWVFALNFCAMKFVGIGKYLFGS